MTEQEIIYTIALSRLPRLSLAAQHELLSAAGSATALYENRLDIRKLLPEANDCVQEALSQMDTQLHRAEEELQFAQRGHIQCIGLNDAAYPARLRECADAPIILFYKGKADLNACHVLAMVGTRQISDYGRDVCRHFVEELASLCPDILIVSGLAYGVDIRCHRAALENNLSTVAVLAHGLDQIYPRNHRDDAIQMLEMGGLVTEFLSQTNPDKKNFVQRNRIVAGMSDATIVVESAAKGGSLITADMAAGYHRDVFAFPGRVYDTYSVGCNQLIRKNKASLLTSAEDFMEAMGWETAEARTQKLSEGVQQELFPDLTADERLVVETLRNCDGMQVNLLAQKTGLPVSTLTSMLFSLEMSGIVAMKSGGTYRLLR